MSLIQPDRILGRSAEESILLNSYFASLSMANDSPASVVIIHGDSGLGKTKLAETLRTHVVEDDGYFIQGKFDQLSFGSANRPYSGISSAFADYFSAVEQRSTETWNEVANKLRSEIKGEQDGKLLSQAIPSLRKILRHDHEEEQKDVTQQQQQQRRHSCDACQHVTEEEEKIPDSKDILSESRSHRFIFLIKRVVSVMSSIGDPIVCLIDDIQWANKTDLDVLKAMMMGAINPFTFIFTCRPGNHPFLQIIADDFGGKTEITLRSLRSSSVRALVAEILNMDDPDDCTSLANFTYRVTDGNPFFIRQQIISLRDERLLRFGSNGWTWDMDELEEKHDDILGNVVIMLSEKMKRLPSLTQQALKICSCIGSKIDLYVLGLLLRETHFVEGSGTVENEALAKKAIFMASQEGLLAVNQDGMGVTFTHDSVNEAAYSLLEPGRQATFHYELGKILQKNVCQTLLRKYLFTIAAQLARGNGIITDEEDRISTAFIFLNAGEKSMAASAFPEAHFFFSEGIKLLHNDDWTSNQNYRLCCDLYIKAADMGGLTADFKDMDKCLKVLFAHCHGASVDFLNASYLQVRSMSTRGNPAALDIGIEALKVAGMNFPSRNLAVHTVLGLAQIRCTMKRKGTERLLELSQITDERIIARLRLLRLIVTIAMIRNQKILPLLTFNLVQMNLTHGMSNSMPSSLAMYGTILGRFGYPNTEIEKYGKIALTLQDKLGCNDTFANLTLVTYGTIFTNFTKFSKCMKPLQAGYDSGIKTGDFAHAGSCAVVIGWMSFFSGKNLTKVAKTLDQLRTSMLEYNMTRPLIGNQVYRNAVDYCLGVSDASRFFVNIESDELPFSCQRTHLMYHQQSKFTQLVVACIFCEHELAWAVSEELGHFERIFRGSVWPYVRAFYRGMAAISMLVMTRSSQFISTVKVCLKQLKKGRKKAPLNIIHQVYLLEAEYAVFRKKYSSAEKNYSLAIEHAALLGVTHEHAYACERFGTYHIRRKNHDAAYEQIREAHRLYSKWGSRPKCELLKKKYPRLGEKELFAPISI